MQGRGPASGAPDRAAPPTPTLVGKPPAGIGVWLDRLDQKFLIYYGGALMAVIHLSERELAELADALHAAVPALDERGQRLAVSLYRLLALGEPVSEARLAERTAIPSDEV